MANFTQYWTNAQWFYENERSAAKFLNHTAGSRFVKCGAAIGHLVYVVTVLSGTLFLAGRMKIGKIVSHREAVRILQDKNLFDAPEHLIGSEYTSLDFTRDLPLNLAAQLEFFRGGKPARLKFAAPGVLDTQTLRGIRRFPAATAAVFDELLAQPKPV